MQVLEELTSTVSLLGHFVLAFLLTSIDPSEQIQDFSSDSDKYTKYCRDIEGELNKRFTLVPQLYALHYIPRIDVG